MLYYSVRNLFLGWFIFPTNRFKKFSAIQSYYIKKEKKRNSLSGKYFLVIIFNLLIFHEEKLMKEFFTEFLNLFILINMKKSVFMDQIE